MPIDETLQTQLKRMSDVLNDRAGKAARLDDYRDGRYPPPPLVQDTQLTQAYRMLMDLSGSNWPGLIVGSVEERLEVQGVRFGDDTADQEAWALWQEAGLDAESSMFHDAILTNGRGYAIVWGDGSRDPQPRITLEHSSLCVVEYAPGPRRERRAALRRWRDDGYWHANLYTPEAVYKFRATQGEDDPPQQSSGWEQRQDEGDDIWPLPNPLGVVPVVEFAVNRSLRPNPFGTAAGEFETNVRHIDRINYKVFSGLVALTWSGFPLRYVIGDPILYEKKELEGELIDDKTKPIPPFKALASAVAQFTNKDAKVGQLPEANVDNYSPEEDIKHLAALTKTPAHYLLGEMVNLSADAIRAGEAGLISKVKRHHRSLGESWEEVIRLAFRVQDPNDPRGSDASAQIIWADPESRSLAERADAGLKMQQAGMPWRVIASKVYGMTPQEIQRADAEVGSDVLATLLEQPAPATNGTGAPPPGALTNGR